MTLTGIGIKPEKGFGTHELHPASKVSALKLLQPACLCLGLFRALRNFGLGEPFGKASLTNTVLGLGRFVSMRDSSSWFLEGELGYPSEAWPDEALKKGLLRPMAKRRKNCESASDVQGLTKLAFMILIKSLSQSPSFFSKGGRT